MRQYLQRVSHRVRGRVLMALIGTLAAGLLASPVGAGDKPGFGCPPAFDLGGLTFAESFYLPRIQAALEEGVYDTSEFAALFDVIDHNGDGVVCFKDVGALTDGAGNWQFFYNAVDNNASPPDR